MIEKIDKTLHLKVELNTKDDCNIIGIEYYLHDTELQRKHSYRPNYRITFENCHQASEINLYDMTDKQIKEYLRPFNPNDSISLIQNFINIKDYGHIDKQKTKYYFDTDFVKNILNPKLDEIILFTHKDTLSLNQKIEKKKRRLQRSISRKYCKNKKGGSYCKTSNIIKREKELLKVIKRLTNIRQNYLHQTTSEIIKRKPSFICMEDLNVSGMMKNKHLSKAVQQQCFYEFRKQIEYKSNWNNISVIIADRFFPSSKLCSCCGNIKKDLKLSDRMYKCECGNIIDRDFQASLNLKQYEENVLKQQFVA